MKIAIKITDKYEFEATQNFLLERKYTWYENAEAATLLYPFFVFIETETQKISRSQHYIEDCERYTSTNFILEYFKNEMKPICMDYCSQAYKTGNCHFSSKCSKTKGEYFFHPKKICANCKWYKAKGGVCMYLPNELYKETTDFCSKFEAKE